MNWGTCRQVSRNGGGQKCPPYIRSGSRVLKPDFVLLGWHRRSRAVPGSDDGRNLWLRMESGFLSAFGMTNLLRRSPTSAIRRKIKERPFRHVSIMKRNSTEKNALSSSTPSADLRLSRSDPGSLPCSTQPRSPSRTPLSSRCRHRPRRWP